MLTASVSRVVWTAGDFSGLQEAEASGVAVLIPIFTSLIYVDFFRAPVNSWPRVRSCGQRINQNSFYSQGAFLMKLSNRS